jgi:error-prone DNA polymerase
MEKKGITGDTQNTIVQSITSFALYGFPESHAASFALIAYASAYLKCHYLAAFTAAMLNNQPMGFYSPLTLVKDAQRHGLHFLPVDVTQSDWPCTLADARGSASRDYLPSRDPASPSGVPAREGAFIATQTAKAPGAERYVKAGSAGDLVAGGALKVRLGFNYVRGLSEETAKQIVSERSKSAFTGIDDLRRRVPRISRAELTSLADLGALNEIGRHTVKTRRHRRDALWQSELALRPVSELLRDAGPPETPSPLLPMNAIERIEADFMNSGLSIGAHPMRFHRAALERMNVVPAAQVKDRPDGWRIRVAGAVICRQQPGTAKGFVFLTLEDETGIANIILKPHVFNRLRTTVLSNPYLLIDGVLQNQRGVVSVKAHSVRPCPVETTAMAASHDFH